MTSTALSTQVKPLASIRLRLYATIIFITLLTLALAVANLFASRAVQQGVRTTISQAGRLSELGLQVQNQFLLAREAESSFLSSWRVIGVEQAKTDFAATHQQHLDTAVRALEEITALTQPQDSSISMSISGEDITRLATLFAEYQQNFQSVVVAVEELNTEGGVEDQLDTLLFNLRLQTSDLQNPAYQQIILEMQFNQQAFLASRQEQYRDKIRILVNRFKDLLAQEAGGDVFAANADVPADLAGQVDTYLQQFSAYAAHENEISVYVESFVDITDEIGQITLRVNEAGAASLASARQQLDTVTRSSSAASIIAAAAAITLGIIASIALARRIIAPLNFLLAAALRLRGGELSHRIDLRTQDEFNVLGVTLNQMAEQLGEMLASLERQVAARTKELQTSIQVSQRLNSILDEKMLVGEVVEQLQKSFGFYHAHIYLFDEEKQYLLMAGGTGDAGRSLLERKHKIARGKGLVGKTAETRVPVLVPDVTQDPNWLPNPLLPETRSELAVPILLADEVLGVLDVQQNQAGALTANDMELLKSIASQVAIALKNAQSFETAHRQAEQEAVRRDIADKIQRAITIEETLQVVVRELGAATSAQRTSVLVGVSQKSPNHNGGILGRGGN
jgi:putative methionine-R-sulfoxide reductase with GAF domain